MDVCSFMMLSFKWLCHWRSDFLSERSLSQALHPRFSQFAGSPREADVSGHARDVGS